MKTVYLALGSNLGRREEHLQEAVNRIEKAGVHLHKVSFTYETGPLYVTDQPMFLNIALEGETTIFPRTLLRRLQAIEREIGRRRTVRNGPRSIDIDMLFYGRSIINAPELIVPHPRLAERRFVLQPLADLAPGLRHPVLHRTVSEMLGQVSGQAAKKVAFQVQLPL